MQLKRSKGRRVADETVKVKDGITEKNAYITNVLITAILIVGGFFGDGVLDYLSSINNNMIEALRNIAAVQEVNKEQDRSITTLKKANLKTNEDIYLLRLDHNDIKNELKSIKKSYKKEYSLSSND